MKIKKRKARCKKVLAILNNKIGIYDLVREDIYPPRGDFDINPAHFAILRVIGAGSYNEVLVSIDTVMFLKD